jgi:cytoskeletal protein RodZ
MTLGRTIRDAREATGLSIQALSDSTNIRITLLTEMESNNFAHCGGDTYARGHLRNIAARIGIDARILIDLYDDQHAIASQRIQDSLAENNVLNVSREKKSLSWKIPALASVIILLLIAVVQIVISNQGSSPNAQPVASAEPSPSAQVENSPVTLEITATRGNSYIDIVVDGVHVEKGSIFQGESKSYQGLTAISIYFSNPAGLDVTVDGKLLPPLGGQNEEVRRTFR